MLYGEKRLTAKGGMQAIITATVSGIHDAPSIPKNSDTYVNTQESLRHFTGRDLLTHCMTGPAGRPSLACPNGLVVAAMVSTTRGTNGPRKAFVVSLRAWRGRGGPSSNALLHTNPPARASFVFLFGYRLHASCDLCGTLRATSR